MRFAAFLAGLAAAFAASLALAAPTFPPLSGRVVDSANLLSAADEAQLDDELAKLETDTSRQLVVATVPDLQGYEIEEYGYQLGRAWGLGDAKRDDGALLIIAPKEKKVRIEVGYGLEGVLTDALSSQIIQGQVLPKFRDGDMPAGIKAGVAAIDQQLRLDPAAAAQQAKAATTQKSKGGGFSGFFVVMIALWIIFHLLPRFGGRRRRRRGGGLGLPALIAWDAATRGSGSNWSGGGSGWSGGGGGGGFSGGGGSFGGGGASGGW